MSEHLHEVDNVRLILVGIWIYEVDLSVSIYIWGGQYEVDSSGQIWERRHSQVGEGCHKPHRHTLPNSWFYRHTDTQAYRQTDKHTHRQTDKQTHRQTNTQKNWCTKYSPTNHKLQRHRSDVKPVTHWRPHHFIKVFASGISYYYSSTQLLV